MEIGELIKERFYDLRSASSIKTKKRHKEIVAQLMKLASQFTLDDLAHLISVMPTKPPQSVTKLYNKVYSKLIKINTKYRYRYVIYNMLNNDNAIKEIKYWMDGKFKIQDTSFISFNVIRMVLMASTSELNKIAAKLVPMNNSQSGALFWRYNELDDKYKTSAINNVNWYSSHGTNFNVELSKDDLDKIHPSNIIQLLNRMSPRWRRNIKFNFTIEDLKKSLFPLSINHGKEVSQLINQYSEVLK